MYTGLLHTHGLLRWILLLLAVVAIFRAFMGWRGNKAFETLDNKLGTFLVAGLHLQLVLGLILLSQSSVVAAAMQDMGAAMKNSAIRLRAIEHPLMMLAGVVLVQIGRIKSKKASADAEKHRLAFVFFTVGLVMILARIPW
jgi:hypothetical protein